MKTEKQLWKCEYGLENYSTFVRERVDRGLGSFDVTYLTKFDETNRGPANDITLDDVECRYLLLGGVDGSILLYDTQTPLDTEMGTRGSRIQVFPKLDFVNSISSSLLPSKASNAPSMNLSPSLCLQWNPVDTGMFISASIDKTFKLWDTNRFECVEAIALAEPITWAAMSPFAVEHNLVAISLCQTTGERQVAIIDPLVGSPTLSFRGGHSQPLVSQVAWSPRNSYTIVTAGEDGRILFWDIRVPVKPTCSLDNNSEPGKPAYSHEALAHNGPVLSVAYSPDGLHLFSWGGTGLPNTATLRIWALDIEGRGCTLFSATDDEEADLIKNTFCSSQPRSTNFGAFCNIPYMRGSQTSQELVGGEAPLQGSSLRMAVAPGLQPGTAWGASAAFCFVPVGQSLLVTAANSSGVLSRRVLKRHFAKIKACVWNADRHEVYTAGLDTNLHVWPLFPSTTKTDEETKTAASEAHDEEEEQDQEEGAIFSPNPHAMALPSF